MEHIYKRYTYIILKIHNTSVYHMIFECMDSGALNPNCPVFLWGEDLLVQLEAQRKTDQTETERLRSHVEVGWEAEVVELEQQTHWNMPQKVPLKIFPKVVYCRVSFWGLYLYWEVGIRINLGGGFNFFWIFTLKSWGNDPIWRAYFFVNGLVQPPTTLNCGECKGILPKLAETFRWRIYNHKLPRKTGSGFPKTIFAGGFSGPGIIFGSGFVGDFLEGSWSWLQELPVSPPPFPNDAILEAKEIHF